MRYDDHALVVPASTSEGTEYDVHGLVNLVVVFDGHKDGGGDPISTLQVMARQSAGPWVKIGGTSDDNDYVAVDGAWNYVRVDNADYSSGTPAARVSGHRMAAVL